MMRVSLTQRQLTLFALAAARAVVVTGDQDYPFELLGKTELGRMGLTHLPDDAVQLTAGTRGFIVADATGTILEGGGDLTIFGMPAGGRPRLRLV